MAEFTSRGQGNLNTVLGAVGTAGAIMPGLFGGLFGGGCNAAAVCSDNVAVNRYELTMAQALSAKDGEIALLKADKYTDQKIVEAYKDLVGQINGLAAEVRSNRDEQQGINLQQAVLNGTTGSTIACMQQAIAQLQGLTKLVIPNSSVCPGWGNVTITPAASTTTT